MKIDAGKLDRVLTLYAATETQEDGGQIVTTWQSVRKLYAQRLELRTVDAARAGQRDTYAIARYLIRYRSDITTAHRLVIADQTFDILAIDEGPERKVSLFLTVEQSTRDPIGGV